MRFVRPRRAARLGLVGLVAAALATAASPPAARAAERSLEGGFLAGGFAAVGSHVGVGGQLALAGAVRPNDWLRVYARLEYGLGAGLEAAQSPFHAGGAALGAAYVFDVLSVTPWLGLGATVAWAGSASWSGPLVGAEVRAGADVLLRRYFALTIQGGGAVYPNELTRLWGGFSLGAGLRWSVDL